MSTPDLILQGFVAVIAIWACWAKWGAPLWAKYSPLRQVSNNRLLTRLFLDNAAAAVGRGPMPITTPLPAPTPTPTPTSVSAPVTTPTIVLYQEPEAEAEAEAEPDSGTDTDTYVPDDDEDDEDEEDDEGPMTPVSASSTRPVYLKQVEPDIERTQRTARSLWLAWMARSMGQALHLIVIGQTGAGKTTVLQVFVDWLVAQGLPVVVCDPDAAAGDWPGAQIFGAGDDFKGITQALKAVQIMARDRRQARAAGQREFDPFWFILDEYADIKDECKIAGTVIENALRRWRKLNMHIVIGVQDTQVGTMGFERKSSLLNHARIVTLKFGAEGRRYARLDETPAIIIPELEPKRGPAQEADTLTVSPDDPETLQGNPVGPLDVGELGDGEETDWVEPTDMVGGGEDKDDQIRTMLAAGRSYAEISSQLHVATTRIARVKRDFQLEA